MISTTLGRSTESSDAEAHKGFANRNPRTAIATITAVAHVRFLRSMMRARFAHVGERPAGATTRLRAEARNGVWALPTFGVQFMAGRLWYTTQRRHTKRRCCRPYFIVFPSNNLSCAEFGMLKTFIRTEWQRRKAHEDNSTSPAAADGIRCCGIGAEFRF